MSGQHVCMIPILRIKIMFKLYLKLVINICSILYNRLKAYNCCKHLHGSMKTLKTLKCEIILININGKCIYIFMNIQVAVLVVLISLWFFGQNTILHNNTDHVNQHDVLFLRLKYQVNQRIYIKLSVSCFFVRSDSCCVNCILVKKYDCNITFTSAFFCLDLFVCTKLSKLLVTLIF